MRVLDHFNSFTTRVMVSLLAFVTLGIIVVSALAFGQIDANSQQNMAIRLDRAARAAASITTHRLAGTFSVERAEDGQPRLIRMVGEALPWKVDTATAFNDLVLEIGAINQGAANFFGWNETTLAFDRFATTFRRPDGSMPPPMALGKDHPAYATIKAGKVFKGNVPVMGRLRYAYLTPIVSQVGTVAGIMAIDVGWLDELLASSDLLRQRIGLSALAILMIVALGGALVLRWQLMPLNRLARFAHHIAEGGSERDVPFTRRPDEIGQLAIGLDRVAVLQDKMTALAYTDTVTGLGNRARFLVDLDRADVAGGVGVDVEDVEGVLAIGGLLVLRGVLAACVLGCHVRLWFVLGEGQTVMVAGCLPGRVSRRVTPDWARPYQLSCSTAVW
jgi:HAMP domain-containing protein